MERLRYSCDLPRKFFSKRFPVVLILVVLVTMTTTGMVRAQSTTWTGGGATNNWSDSGNWSGGVPQNNWTVYMVGGGSSCMDIWGLYLGMLNMTGFPGTLYLNYNLTVQGTAILDGFVQMQGRRLEAYGNIIISDLVNINGGDLIAGSGFDVRGDVNGPGNIQVTGNVTGDSNGALFGALTIAVMSGDVILDQLYAVNMVGGILSMTGGGNLTAPTGATFGSVYYDGIGSMTTGTGGATIDGTFVVNPSSSLNISASSLNFLGAVTISSGATVYNDTGPNRFYDFNGYLTINSGTFRVTGSGCELSFGGSQHVDVNGTGTFEITGGTGADQIKLQQEGSAGGLQWTLDYEPTTTVSVWGASIQDGIAVPPLYVINCVDLGNNVDFLFAQDIEVSPMALDFGAVPTLSTGTDTLTVYNRGTVDLTVSNITNNLTQFSVSPTSFVVAGLDSQLVVVDFTPDAPGIYVDSLTVTSDDPDESTVVVDLTGRGAAPDILLSFFSAPSELKNGSEEVVIQITLMNLGDLPTGMFRVSSRISADSIITTDDVIIDTAYVADILPMGTEIVNLQARLPKEAPRGDVYVGGIADDLDDVVELVETNNAVYWPFAYHVPLINNARDVPNDQGGVVYLSWYASPLDDASQSGLITEYSLWRAIDAGVAAAMFDAGAALFTSTSKNLEKAADVIRVENAAGQEYFWQLIDTHPAYLLDAYAYDMPTLFDSTATGFEYHYFQVIAHTSDRFDYYVSAQDSGYSVDNLAPATPQNLVAEQTEPEGLQLTWDPNTEADLSHYAVYRGTDAGFTPGPGNLVGEPADPGLFDGGWRWDGGYYYKVSAVDVHGNESLFAVSGPGLVVGAGDTGPPKVNFLHQNRPNPFGAGTRIAFGLTRDTDVTIHIYDVKGRLVKTLVDGRRAADRHTVVWNGRDNRGRLVSGGIYFYRIEAGEFVQTKKMTLLR